jgi:hypothetical protein
VKKVNLIAIGLAACSVLTTSFQVDAAGTFVDIAAGGDGARPFACGVEASGGLQCWGNNQFGQISPPDGDFVEVGAGAYHACGRRDDNTIACWGADDLENKEAPAGSFAQLAIGYFGPNCARRSNGTIACWGFGEKALDVPAGAFDTISAGAERACAFDDGEPTCWRYVEGNTPSDIEMEAVDIPAGPFAEISMYYDIGATRQDRHFCGRRTNGQVTCWTDEEGKQPWIAPTGTFASLSSGGGLACGIRTNGHIECWGPDWIEGNFLPPEGEFVAAAAGAGHVCGLAGDGCVVCSGGAETASCSSSPECGNGNVEDPETCDDGDTTFVAGEACTGACVRVPCGQPLHPEADGPASSDALFTLQAAVGNRTCDIRVCDADGSFAITVADALVILRSAVGSNLALSCQDHE